MKKALSLVLLALALGSLVGCTAEEGGLNSRGPESPLNTGGRDETGRPAASSGVEGGALTNGWNSPTTRESSTAGGQMGAAFPPTAQPTDRGPVVLQRG